MLRDPQEKLWRRITVGLATVALASREKMPSAQLGTSPIMTSAGTRRAALAQSYRA